MMKKLQIRTAFLALGLAAATSMAPALAAPTAQITGGYTLVELTPEFVAALGTLAITPSKNLPGTLHSRIALFPITGGRLDASNARGEIPHAGGLKLTRGTTQVILTDFVIDTASAAGARLTGLVTANGSVVGRVPLFNVALPALQLPLALPPAPEQILIEGNRLTLTAEAAAALNGAFGVTAFAAGFNIGVASVYGNY